MPRRTSTPDHCWEVYKALAHFARFFNQALQRLDEEEVKDVWTCGHESLVANDLLSTGTWQVIASWLWKRPAHINILESCAFVTLLKHLATRGGGVRFSALLDSRVAKGSISKGRSSAYALSPALRRAAAIQVAFGLYPSLGFAPTRLNVADDPTRDQRLREPAAHSILPFLSPHAVRELHAVGFSRTCASWLRLAILLMHLGVNEACNFASPVSALEPLWTFGLHGLQWIFGLLSAFLASCLAVWICMGLRRCHCRIVAWFWIWHSLCLPSSPFYYFGLDSCPSASHSSSPLVGTPWASTQRSIFCFSSCFHLSHGVAAAPLTPAGAEESEKAQRRAGVALIADRVLRPQTRTRREQLLDMFESWLLVNQRLTLEQLLNRHECDADFVSETLVAYGKELYYAGKPYGRYSETINAVAAKRPTLKRLLVGAWDLAFAWVTDEPHAHHPAMPLSVVLAFSGLALLWGWPVEASLLLMTWTGILRIGEALAALRKDLVLPQDAAPGTWFALLQIRQPKTRGSAARHQSARIDPADVVALLTATFGKLPRESRLWPFSGQTLRRRFQMLQRALGLPLVKIGGQAPFDLASLRPGGATFLLQRFEDAELVRRRGRWLSGRVMEIYLQEVSVATYVDRMPPKAFSRISGLSASFKDILQKAIFLSESSIPATCWPRLF